MMSRYVNVAMLQIASSSSGTDLEREARSTEQDGLLLDTMCALDPHIDLVVARKLRRRDGPAAFEECGDIPAHDRHGSV
jgi:hypothetical protein